jgi:hypothetical protein
VLQYCREHRNERHVLSKLCYHGIRAVCQMIFLDNFVHGTIARCCLHSNMVGYDASHSHAVSLI